MRIVPRTRAAFTLVELLVTMGIIAILATITVVSIGAISSSSRMAVAQNAVIASLEQGRGLAIHRNEVVIVVFRVSWDPDDGGRQVTEVVLATWTGDTIRSTTSCDERIARDRFEVIPDVQPRRLPQGVKVAAPFYDVQSIPNQLGCSINFEGDAVWNTQPELRLTESGQEIPTGRLIGIMFSPQGTIITTNSNRGGDQMFVDFDRDLAQDAPGTTTGGEFACWVYDERGDEPNVEPAPFLAIYDDDEAREQQRSSWSGCDAHFRELAGPEGYISLNADRLHFNRYTGVVMR